MQNWQLVLNFLRARENMTADLDTICAGITVLSREKIRAALKELVESGDILEHPPFPLNGNKTWEALTLTKFDDTYERAVRRALKAEEAWNKLSELNFEENELCLRYISGNSNLPKIIAIGSYKKRTGINLATSKRKIESHIRFLTRPDYAALYESFKAKQGNS